ncbi:hypothetical protein F4859DRAFT_511688 [Xylaria cf. heliscus]|nr:hypothetical protein F4859DRAFT_511688 [Xylaria cf. heliscus]
MAYRDPPPSYAEATADQADDAQRCHSMATNANTNTNIAQATTAVVYFPPVFCLYCLGARHYVIGETRYSPLYAVATHPALSARPDVVMYSGASEDSPPLAFITHEPLSRSAGITLPARAGSRIPASHELLESSSAFPRILSFAIETATAVSEGRKERFEWRHSSGVEVEALGGRRSGWKLVRVSSSSAPLIPPVPPAVVLSPSTSDHPTTKRDAGKKKHGKKREVVAVWAVTGMPLATVLRFRFLGSGADGSLGEKWAVVAVASALAIWNRDIRARRRGMLATASF